MVRCVWEVAGALRKAPEAVDVRSGMNYSTELRNELEASREPPRVQPTESGGLDRRDAAGKRRL